jgi:two-component system, LytTR family, sensor kinase
LKEEIQNIKLSLRGFWIQYVGWWVGWAVLQTLVLYHVADVEWSVAIKDAAITNGVLGLAGFEMVLVMRHYQPRQTLRFVWSVVLALCCTAFVKWLLTIVLEEEVAYLDFVRQWIVVRALFAWLVISFITAISWMWFYMKDQQEAQLRKADTEKLAREAELSTLRQQLQPHFLFNSLNSISALAGSRPEEARKMIQQLSDFLRGTIRRDDQQMIPLEEELNHLYLYLEIEKVRFGHRLTTSIEKQNDPDQLKLPPLLLQPVVENAIKFGLYDTVDEILIRIQAKAEGGQLILTVENPFDPATAQPKQGTGFGLTSIQRRLYLLFGRNDLLKTQQKENTFITEVRIPQPL